MALVLLLHGYATPLRAAEPGSEAPKHSVFIPILGNTAESDLRMLGEVNDRHVFDPEQVSTALLSTATLPHNNDLWQKLRQARRLPLTVNEAVEAQKRRYLKEAMWISKILHRSTPYLQYIVSRLEARGLPLDLALLPAVESAFRPGAVSQLQAKGLWQIVPATAGEIGLKTTPWFDGRSDLHQSTRAALDYLSYLNAEFNGEWELTLAAYNAGPGRVKKALRRNLRRDIAGDFWSLPLPGETRQYLPRFTALLELIHENPSPLDLPAISTEPYIAIVDVGKRISLDQAASIAEVPVSTLSGLNTGLLQGVTPPSGPHLMVVPASHEDRFLQNLQAAKRPDLHSNPRTHLVAVGDSVSSIAHHYGIKQKLLRELNKLTGDKILVGQKLVVLDARGKNRQRQTDAENHELSYTIQRGDTLSAIALKFNVKMANIKFSSGASAIDKVLIPGKTLRIPVDTQEEKG